MLKFASSYWQSCLATCHHAVYKDGPGHEVCISSLVVKATLVGAFLGSQIKYTSGLWDNDILLHVIWESICFDIWIFG